jgi:DNA sulfur modification protein DndE
MNFRLRTSRLTGDTLKSLQASTGLTPNIIARIAVALSLRNRDPVVVREHVDTGGLEFHRDTLTGDFDYVFKALIAQHTKRAISDEEYFPGLFKAHLERGVKLLYDEYQYAGNYERLIANLLSL